MNSFQKNPKKKQNRKKQNKHKESFVAKIQTNTGKKVVCIVVWLILGFIMIRGVASMLRTSPIDELTAKQTAFLEQADIEATKQLKISAFTENFIKNYCTYEKTNLDDYKYRVSEYAEQSVANEIFDGMKLVDDADAVYTQTLDFQKISEKQYDLTVLVEIIYTTYVKNDISVEPPAPKEPTMIIPPGDNIAGETIPPASAETPPVKPISVSSNDAPINPVTYKKTLYYKVPVYYNNGNCLIEDIPMITVPTTKDQEYVKTSVIMTEVSDTRKNEIQVLVNDFTKSLFEESQSKINYYLENVKNIEKFNALDTSMKLVKVSDIYVYEKSDDKYLVLVTATVSDVNGSVFKQKFNLTVIKKDRYLIEDMGLRTHNLSELN